MKYTVTPSDESEIWIVRRKKNEWTDLERISTFPPMRLYPAFSPDGTKLAYTQFRRDKVLDVVEEIGILDLSERKFKLITEDGADSFKPAWSPEGKQTAYTSNKGRNYDIWFLSLGDGKERQLTRHAA